MTREEMLKAIENLPEEEKGWSDVKRALRTEASDRDIERCYRKRCEVIPELVAWQKVQVASEQLNHFQEMINNFFEVDGDPMMTMALASGSKMQDFENFKKSIEPKMDELRKTISDNKEMANEWEKITGKR